MHKIKQNEGYSRKRSVLNKSGNGEGRQNFKLNSIVEEARMEVGQVPQREGYSDLTDSIATNSR